MRSVRISVKTLFITIIFTVLLLAAYYLYLTETDYNYAELTFAGLLYTAAFVLGLVVIKAKTGEFVSLMTFFWTSFYLFHGAQVILNILGMGDYTSYNIFRYFSLQEIIKATYYSTVCELLFVLGIMLNPVKSQPKTEIVLDEYLTTIRDVAVILLAVSAIPFAIYVVMVLRVGISVGYGAINDYSNYASSTLMKILAIMADAFLVGSFLMIISNYHKKLVYRVFAGIVIGYSAFLLALGERTEPTSLILLLLWMDNYNCRMLGDEKRARRKTIIALVLLVLLITTFPSIMALRHRGIISVSTLVEDIQENGLFGSIKESLAGVGYSMMPLIEVRRLVAQGEPLRLGVSYLAAFTNVVPLLGFANQYATLSTWLMNTLHMNYGPGFSMAAEAYLNFGVFPFPMVLFGFFFSKILMWKKDKYDVPKMLRGIIFIITCLTLPRRDFCSRVRDIAYLVILLPVLIDSLYSWRITKKGQSTGSSIYESSTRTEQTG